MAAQISVVDSISAIPRDVWNQCLASTGSAGNPLCSHEFFSAVEESGSAGASTGWSPRHLVLRENGHVTGVAPCYLKSHSQGEYVFDHGWADAFHRAGGRYYPKLQVAIPFTPVTGPRLFTDTDERRALLGQGLRELCASESASSVHITFAAPQDVKALGGKLWLLREDIQFHWHNPGYSRFDDFLGSLSSSKRKTLRKERQAVRDLGITFEHTIGSGLTEEHWDHFFAFYMDTGSRKWGRPYLTRSFFSRINATMADRILLILARRDGRYIAGALNFIGSDSLYGRNWGCVEHHPFLHFETCYYQAQDFAIAKGLRTVEAGAQGEHKLARGYLPVKTASLHYLAHPGLRRAVADYLEGERAAVTADQQALAGHAPFRHSGDVPERDE